MQTFSNLTNKLRDFNFAKIVIRLGDRFRSSLSEFNRSKHEKKRTGPGRKSNAEHAIAFYEYLAGDTGIGDKDKSTEDTSESSDDDESSSSSDQSSASNTVDTEEFLNQHDDACDVCNLGGELICCSTCSLVFHKECLRPVMKSIPSDWICPYCITQGVNNYKRHSKTWKSAAIAIRQMKRLRKELESSSQQTKKNESVPNEVIKEEMDETTVDESGTDNAKSKKEKSLSKDDMIYSMNEENLAKPIKEKDQQEQDFQQKQEDQKKVDSKDSKGGNTSAASSVSDAGAMSDSKRNLALYKIADSHSNSIESLVLHGRRQRKQPALYQPQLCAASRWKSDEKNHETDSSDDNSDDNSNDPETDRSKKEKDESQGGNRIPRRVLKKKKMRNSKNETKDNVVICIGDDAIERKKTGSPFCNFCHDDASILICVFCGCRNCYGKFDKNSLVLCDNCDDEYHIVCLGLKTVPSAKNWYCPSCSKTKSTTTPKLSSTRQASFAMAQANATGFGSESDNSKRSSPGKKTRSMSAMSTKTVAAAGKTTTDVEVLDKRTRGRPSKFKTETESQHSLLSPRKRARTPKGAANSIGIMEQRKRGRQSKSTMTSPTTTPSLGRKRGRPAKNAPITTPILPPKSSPSSQPRKRGRPSKATPGSVVIPTKVDSTIRKKVQKPTTPLSTTSNTSNNSGISEFRVKPQEPIKVSRVSGRTVKRASFYDEVDEGEQHLKSAPIKSQESQVHRINSKTPERSEPARKKQKHEDKTATQNKDTPSEIKPSKSQIKKSTIVEDKEEEMTDPPPIAPVRMKPVLQPPAPPIAPVRMKPVLQPPIPAIRPPVSVPEIPNVVEKKKSSTEETKTPIVDAESKKEEKNESKINQTDAAPTTTKPEVSKKMEPPPTTPPSQKINKPEATVASKAITSKSATPNTSPTFVQEVPSSGPTTGTSSIASSFPSTPLLDPVALEAAVKALPEPKEKKGEKGVTKTPRRKPGARECMQISRRFGVNIIPEKYMTTLLDYCRRGKVEHLIKMRERLDCHSRFLEFQLAGLEARIKEVGESKIVVPAMPPHKRDSSSRHRGGGGSVLPTSPSLNKKPALGGSKAAVAAQALGKKPPLVSQTASLKTEIENLKTKFENKTKKISPITTKPTATETKLPISSFIPTATKPSLSLPLEKQTKIV